jgi:hypothetical protein
VSRSRGRLRFWVLTGLAGLVFVVVSLLVGRALTGPGDERAAVLVVAQAEARGDANAVLAEMPSCRADPRCAGPARARTPALRRAGHVEILAYAPSIRVTLTSHTGLARVAWRAGQSFPVVQCVTVRRGGPLSGTSVELLSISPPIHDTAPCRVKRRRLSAR